MTTICRNCLSDTCAALWSPDEVTALLTPQRLALDPGLYAVHRRQAWHACADRRHRVGEGLVDGALRDHGLVSVLIDQLITIASAAGVPRPAVTSRDVDEWRQLADRIATAISRSSIGCYATVSVTEEIAALRSDYGRASQRADALMSDLMIARRASATITAERDDWQAAARAHEAELLARDEEIVDLRAQLTDATVTWQTAVAERELLEGDVARLTAQVAERAQLESDIADLIAQVATHDASLSDYRAKLLAIGHVIDCYGPVDPETRDPRSWLQYADRIASAVKQVKYQVATLEADGDKLRAAKAAPVLTSEMLAGALDAVSLKNAPDVPRPRDAKEIAAAILAALGSVALPSPVVTPPSDIDMLAVSRAIEDWRDAFLARYHVLAGGTMFDAFRSAILAARRPGTPAPSGYVLACDLADALRLFESSIPEGTKWTHDGEPAEFARLSEIARNAGPVVTPPVAAPEWQMVVRDEDAKPDQYDITQGAWTLRARTGYSDGLSHSELLCQDVVARESWWPTLDAAKAGALAWCREICALAGGAPPAATPAPAPRAEVPAAAGTEWKNVTPGITQRIVGPYALDVHADRPDHRIRWTAHVRDLDGNERLVAAGASIDVETAWAAADAWAAEQHAAMGRDLAQPAAQPVPAMVTVGALLSTHPIGTIAEYNGEHDGADFRQTRITSASGLIESRWHSGGKWHRWRNEKDIAIDGADLRKPARAVAPDDVDADPATRGDIARSITPPTSRRPEIGDRVRARIEGEVRSIVPGWMLVQWRDIQGYDSGWVDAADVELLGEMGAVR